MTRSTSARFIVGVLISFAIITETAAQSVSMCGAVAVRTSTATVVTAQSTLVVTADTANYPANARCELTLSLDAAIPQGWALRIRPTAAAIESGDRLYAYDGPNASTPLLMSLGGSSVPSYYSAVNSTQGTVFLLFTSDGSSQAAGPQLTVDAVPPLPSDAYLMCPTAPSITKTSTLAMTPGFVTTVFSNLATTYAPSMVCQLTITAPAGWLLRIKPVSVALDTGTSDTIFFYNGPNTTTQQALRLSSTSIPSCYNQVNSTTDTLFVRLATGGSAGSTAGVRFTVEAVPPLTSENFLMCPTGQGTTKTSSLVMTPGLVTTVYTNLATSYAPSITCELTIIASAPPGWVLRVKPISAALESSNSDTMFFYNGATAVASQLALKLSSSIPTFYAQVNSTGQTMFVRLGGGGFALTAGVRFSVEVVPPLPSDAFLFCPSAAQMTKTSSLVVTPGVITTVFTNLATTYAPSITCELTAFVDAPPGWVLRMKPISVALESNAPDLLNFHDGANTSMPLAMRMSYSTIPTYYSAGVNSTQRVVFIRMAASGLSGSTAGARFTLEAVPPLPSDAFLFCPPAPATTRSSTLTMTPGLITTVYSNLGPTYANSITCQLTVTAPAGWLLRIKPVSVALDTNAPDILWVYQGTAAVASQLALRLSSTNIPAYYTQVNSTGQSVYVVLGSSGSAGSTAGVRFTVEAVPPLPSDLWNICPTGQGTTKSSSLVVTPAQSLLLVNRLAVSEYAPSITCEATVFLDAPGDWLLRLRPSTPNVGSGDALTAYDGMNTSMPVLLTLTGTSIPALYTQVNATQRVVFVRFTSDGSTQSTGAPITVEAVQPSRSFYNFCPPVASQTRTTTLTVWPDVSVEIATNAVSEYPPSVTCTVQVSAPPGCVLRLRPTSIKTGNSGDHMKAYDGTTTAAAQLGTTWTGNPGSMPAEVNATAGTALVQFISDGSTQGAGIRLLAASWCAVQQSSSATATPSVTASPVSATATGTATLSPVSASLTPSESPSVTASPSSSASSSASSSNTPSSSVTASVSASGTGSGSTTASLSPSASGTGSGSTTASATPSASGTGSITATSSVSASTTGSSSAAASVSPSTSSTGSITATPSLSASSTGSGSASSSVSITASSTASGSYTASRSSSLSASASVSASTVASISVSASPSASASASGSASSSGSASMSGSVSVSASASVTASLSTSASVSASGSASASPTPAASTIVVTRSPTATTTTTPAPSPISGTSVTLALRVDVAGLCVDLLINSDGNSNVTAAVAGSQPLPPSALAALFPVLDLISSSAAQAVANSSASAGSLSGASAAVTLVFVSDAGSALNYTVTGTDLLAYAELVASVGADAAQAAAIASSANANVTASTRNCSSSAAPALRLAFVIDAYVPPAANASASSSTDMSSAASVALASAVSVALANTSETLNDIVISVAIAVGAPLDTVGVTVEPAEVTRVAVLIAPPTAASPSAAAAPGGSSSGLKLSLNTIGLIVGIAIAVLVGGLFFWRYGSASVRRGAVRTGEDVLAVKYRRGKVNIDLADAAAASVAAAQTQAPAVPGVGALASVATPAQVSAPVMHEEVELVQCEAIGIGSGGKGAAALTSTSSAAPAAGSGNTGTPTQPQRRASAVIVPMV